MYHDADRNGYYRQQPKPGFLRGGERMDEKLSQYLTTLAEIACDMSYTDWCLALHIIDKKFSSEKLKVRLNNPEEIKSLMKLEFSGRYSDTI